MKPWMLLERFMFYAVPPLYVALIWAISLSADGAQRAMLWLDAAGMILALGVLWYAEKWRSKALARRFAEALSCEEPNPNIPLGQMSQAVKAGLVAKMAQAQAQKNTFMAGMTKGAAGGSGGVHGGGSGGGMGMGSAGTIWGSGGAGGGPQELRGLYNGVVIHGGNVSP